MVRLTYMHVAQKKYKYRVGNHGDAPVFVFRNNANGLTSTISPGQLTQYTEGGGGVHNAT